MALKSLVRSTVVLGSSSLATTLIAILRVKVLAMLVGPAGVGLLGLLAGIASAGTTLAAFGTDTSGTRQLALDKDERGGQRRLRRALTLVAAVHGAIAIAAFYLLREPIAAIVIGDTAHAADVALLGVVVALSLIAGLRIAELQGLGHVGDIARINIAASLAGTIVGLLAVWQLGLAGLIVLVLAQPAFAALLGLLAAGRTAPSPTGERRATALLADWRRLVAEGGPYMLSFLVLALVPLAIRAIVAGDMGLEAAGHFHAAWTLSVVYVSFLLGAMSADYFPRLTGLVATPPAAIDLVNRQVELGLAIGGTLMLGVLALAPILVPLLYSPAFAPAVPLVEWQALGNLMKIAGWPIAFLSMARGRAMQFLALEISWSAVLIGLVVLGLPRLGLEATGIAFAAATVVFLVLQTTVATWTFGFAWERRPLLLLAAFTVAALATLAAARLSLAAQIVTGGLFACLLGLSSLRLVLQAFDDRNRFVGGVRRAFSRLGWPLPAPRPAPLQTSAPG